MDCPRTIRGLSAGCPWADCGQSVDNARTVHRLSTDSPWALRGLSVGSLWETCGLSVDYP